jgi:hypothetical protein
MSWSDRSIRLSTWKLLSARKEYRRKTSGRVTKVKMATRGAKRLRPEFSLVARLSLSFVL